ncbi:MAG: DUF6754 domain-containing protein [bacterium]
MRKLIPALLVMVLMLLPPPLAAQEDTPAVSDSMAVVATPVPPAPAGDVRAEDAPNDDGHAIVVRWEISPDDGGGRNNVISYKILRAESPDATVWSERDMVPNGTNEYSDAGEANTESPRYFPKNQDFYYRVDAYSIDTFAVSAIAGPAQAQDEWFDTRTLAVLFFVLAFLLATLYYINAAKKEKKLYIRPLAGIEAIDDAIGRATEMGRPTLYIFGLGTAADIATIASFAILARVARKVAEYQTPLLVPIYDPLVLTVAEDTVRAAYMDAGRPDEYDPNSVYFVTQSQFAYVAAVNGTMLREKPAANFYLGKFYAESLLLAETGALAGSIQISGTDEITQLPFFLVACDYTLIGEELYAASVYLSREPILLGTLKAQDWMKGLVVFALLAALVLRAVFDVDLLETIFAING